MNNIKQALESAIKAIEVSPIIDKYGALKIPAINQCKAALAELDKCEPVKGVIISEGSPTLLSDKYIKATDIRLYTSPQPREWQWLGNNTIQELLENTDRDEKGICELIDKVQEISKQLNTKG